MFTLKGIFLKLISVYSIKLKLEAFFSFLHFNSWICIMERTNHSNNIEMPLISQEYFKELVKLQE